MQQLRTCLLWAYLIFSIVGFLVALLRLLRGCLNRPPATATGPVDSHVVPVWAFRAPDPLIYSQQWLLARGLAVTWQNPDIHLELPTAPGVAVDPTSLTPDTVYRVFARTWNGSADAPVAKMPVAFSYLDFGIGGVSIPIGSDEVDLPVKGAVGTPAIATVDWHTPATPGHYCLQVRLIWPHDADPGNNLGQHNTDVKPLNSPRAAFAFPLRNDGPRRQALRLAADGYAIPRAEPCDERPKDDDLRAREERARRRHDPRRHRAPEGWGIELAPERLVLAPGEQVDVRVNVSAPDGFRGRQAINVNAFDHAVLTGGVTLYAEGRADG
jgi:hypothetical protein